MTEDQSDRSCVVLEDILNLYDKQPQLCHVILKESGLWYKRLEGSNNNNRADEQDYEQIAVQDIVGCQCMRDKRRQNQTTCSAGPLASNHNDQDPVESIENSDTDGGNSRHAYFCVYAYPLRKGKFFNKGLQRTRTPLLLRIDGQESFSGNLKIAQRWKNAINRLVRRLNCSQALLDDPVPPRRLLIFVNPHSGPGKALQIFQQRVSPILAEADVGYQLIITDRANHAKDFVRAADLEQWAGIVIVSGDGLIFEVINGLMERSDWKVAIEMPIGVIPGGSGNGLARTIGHVLGEPYLKNTVLCSALNLISGQFQHMDLVRVETPGQVLYSFLSIGWGLLADIDIESEKLRAIGEQRFTIWALARILGLRSYRGRVSFLPEKGYSYINSSHALKSQCLHHSTTFGMDGTYRKIEESVPKLELQSMHLSDSVPSHLSSISNLSDAVSALEECSESNGVEVGWPAEDSAPASFLRSSDTDIDQYDSVLPPLDCPVPDTWTVIEDEFLMVYVAYQTHIGSDVFFAPKAKLDDGIMWMVIIKKGATRAQIFNFVLAMESGEHILCPFVDVIPVQAIRIEPFTAGGYLTVDGEEVDYGPLQAEVLPSIAKIMIR